MSGPADLQDPDRHASRGDRLAPTWTLRTQDRVFSRAGRSPDELVARLSSSEHAVLAVRKPQTLAWVFVTDYSPPPPDAS